MKRILSFAALLISAVAAGTQVVPGQSLDLTTANPFSSSVSGVCPSSGGGTTNYLRADGTWAAPPGSGGSGTVTSVGLSLPSIFSVSGSPVTSSGTLTGSFATESANIVFAGPSSGSAAQPTFRSLVAADVPTLNQNTTGTAANITATSNSSLTTLSALSLPYSQITGTPSPVTSVALSVPASTIFGVTGSPITSSGTLGLTVTGTSGGIPYFDSTSTLKSTLVLAQSAIVLGSGAGFGPSTLGSLGTTTTVLHGNAAGVPSFGAVALNTDVTGNLPVTNLNSGTSASSTTFWRGDGTWATPVAGSGTVTSVSLTMPGIFSVSGSPVTTSGTLTVSASGTSGGVPYFSSSSAMASSGALGSGLLVLGGGAGSAPTALTGNTTTTNQYLAQQGTGSASAPPVWSAFLPPVIQTETSGSGTMNLPYYFIITSGNATAASTYTNNSITFTTFSTVSSSTIVVMTGSGPPTSTGTLTKASGTGDSTITFSRFIAPIDLHIRMVGGGAGGSGGGANDGGASGGGGDTTFGSSFLTAGGGNIAGGSSTPTPGSGGMPTVNAGAYGNGWYGSSGQYGGWGAATLLLAGGVGGSTPFGGPGKSGGGNQVAAVDNQANTGAGGSGGGVTTTTNEKCGSGGGAGAFVDVHVPNWSSAWANSFSYAIGAAGTAGSAGTNGSAGGKGSSGFLWAEAIFQ